MTSTRVDEILRSREFNQRLGQELLEWAKDGRKKAYEDIEAAGVEKAIEKMADWTVNNGLSLVYVRDYLETMIDVDFTAEHVDAMNMEEYDKWCERADEYVADKKKAVIPRKGYQKWFLDKWFATVSF